MTAAEGCVAVRKTSVVAHPNWVKAGAAAANCCGTPLEISGDTVGINDAVISVLATALLMGGGTTKPSPVVAMAAATASRTAGRGVKSGSVVYCRDCFQAVLGVLFLLFFVSAAG